MSEMRKNRNLLRKVNPMYHTDSARTAVCLTLVVAALLALPGCTKRIDTSNEDKFYKTWTEVMESLPASKQKDFDEGMSMFWFYSKNDAETYAMIDGKSGKEILALIEEMNQSLPKLDASSKEAYESSLAKMKAALPPSKIDTFNSWLREMPAYRQGNAKISALDGLPFHKIVENRSFANGQNDLVQKQNQ